MPTVAINLSYHSAEQRAIFEHPSKKKIVRAGRRYGKTKGAAIRVLAQCFEKKGLRCLWVDTVQTNIDKYVNEVFIPMLPREAYEWNAHQKTLKILPGILNSQVDFRSAERPQNIEGFGYQLIVMNEAGIILKMRPRLWSQTLAPMSIEGVGADVMVIGTPKEGAYAYKELSEKAQAGQDGWVEFVKSTYDNPTLTKAVIDELVKDTPEELYRSEFLAEWIDSNAGYLAIPAGIVKDAIERVIIPIAGIRSKWGVDVAGAGGDEGSLAKRCGALLLETVEGFRESDTMRFAAMIRDRFDECSLEERPSDIYIDANGISKGVYDRLRQDGLPARQVMVQSASSQERFFSLRDELWFRGRQWFEEGGVSIPNDRMLIRQLTTPIYDPNHGRGKIKVESKKELKKRGSPSPDRADGFLLTFAGGRDRIQSAPAWMQKKKHIEARGSWMSA